METVLKSKIILPLAALVLLGMAAEGRAASGHERLAQTQLPRCVLYSSERVTPQGLMRCSYQCGDRIIIRSGYMSCPTSAARPSAR